MHKKHKISFISPEIDEKAVLRIVSQMSFFKGRHWRVLHRECVLLNRELVSSFQIVLVNIIERLQFIIYSLKYFVFLTAFNGLSLCICAGLMFATIITITCQ
eukprot:256647_1